jgi:two-component system response regulator PilR (NtrC family)
MTGFSSNNVRLRQASYMGIISESSLMQKVFGLINKVSKSNSTVLILGESGTGKELVARAIHKASGRTGKLVPVNCGAIPEEILESELFGHEKGAFTGAIQNKIGRFQLADSGTIFLDEIGEMSPKLQVKLLRVLQERTVEPVGSTKSVEVNVRVIAATNKDLREEVKRGRFREDLYYRLQVVPVELPALRERDNDVSLLSRYFLERTASQNGQEPIKIPTEVMEKLSAYSWPGNIRELENLMERLAILSDGPELSLNDLPEYFFDENSQRPIQHVKNTIDTNSVFVDSVSTDIPEEGIDFNELVNRFENSLIAQALDKTAGNKKAAAKLLGLNRTTLVEKIKKKGLESKIEVIRVDDETKEEFSNYDSNSYATVELG